MLQYGRTNLLEFTLQDWITRHSFFNKQMIKVASGGVWCGNSRLPIKNVYCFGLPIKNVYCFGRGLQIMFLCGTLCKEEIDKVLAIALCAKKMGRSSSISLFCVISTRKSGVFPKSLLRGRGHRKHPQQRKHQKSSWKMIPLGKSPNYSLLLLQGQYGWSEIMPLLKVWFSPHIKLFMRSKVHIVFQQFNNQSKDWKQRKVSPLQEDRFKPWSFFDGASRENIGSCGAEGALFSSDTRQGAFECRVGVGTNNMVELRMVYILMALANELGLNSLLVMGDSMLVIQWVEGGYEGRNLEPHDLMANVRKLKKLFK